MKIINLVTIILYVFASLKNNKRLKIALYTEI